MLSRGAFAGETAAIIGSTDSEVRAIKSVEAVRQILFPILVIFSAGIRLID